MGVPRRNQMMEWTRAEAAIHGAVQIVEEMGADVRLTDAVCLLQAARESVADFVDRVESRRLPSRCVERPTGRVIPDMTGLEHVCSYQATVKLASPNTLPADDEIKPCPWCDRGPGMLVDDEPDPYVRCDCGAEGPRSETEDGAIEAWNTRPADAELARVREERDSARAILSQCWEAAGLLGPNMTGKPDQAWEYGADLVQQIEDLSGRAGEEGDREALEEENDRLIAERDRLREACEAVVNLVDSSYTSGAGMAVMAQVRAALKGDAPDA